MSKPNAILAQSGGPTAVNNASACGVIQELIKSGKVGKVIGAANGILVRTDGKYMSGRRAGK
jgi:6-phosphofructokinase